MRWKLREWTLVSVLLLDVPVLLTGWTVVEAEQEVSKLGHLFSRHREI